MKTWEALKAADEGKKIRRKYWMKGVYSIKEESSWAGDTALVTRHRRGTCECVSLERRHFKGREYKIITIAQKPGNEYIQ